MHINPLQIVSSILSIVCVFCAPSYAMERTKSSLPSGQKAKVVITTARFRELQPQQNIQSKSSYAHSRNILQGNAKRPAESKSGAFKHNVIIELKPCKQQVSQVTQTHAMVDYAELTDRGLAFVEAAEKNLESDQRIQEGLKVFEDEQKIIKAAQAAAREYQVREEKKRAELATLKALGFIFPEDA